MKISHYRIPKNGNDWEKMLLSKLQIPPDGIPEMASALDPNAMEQKLHNLKSRKWNRAEIKTWLERELEGFDVYEKQKINLQKLEDPSCVIVTTGQQPGLLGGPALWLHKAYTAIALAEHIENKFNVPSLALFWIAGDDSDLKECNHVYFPESSNLPNFLNFKNPKDNIPVALRKFPDDLENWRGKLSSIWSPETLELLNFSLRPGDSFVDSFKRIFQLFLGATGMLMANGFAPEFRRLSYGAMSQIIHRGAEFSRAFDKRKLQLQKNGIALQLDYPENTLHAFYIKNGARNRLFYKEKDVLYTSKENWSLSHFFERLAAEKNVFLSHDAVSRPLLIESCLPIAAHVLGPHELGYFQQLKHAFWEFNGDIPLAFPRAQLTMLEKSFVEKFDNMGFFLESLPGLSPELFMKGATQNFWDRLPPEERKAVETYFNLGFKSHPLGKQNEKNMGFNLETLIKNYQKQLVKLQNLTLEKAKRKIFLDRVPHIHSIKKELNWLASGRGQDRHLNVFSFINKLGFKDYKKILSQGHFLESQLQWLIYEK